MTAMNLTPNPAASDLDQTIAALTVAVDHLKNARAAGTAEYGDGTEQLVRSLAKQAHRVPRWRPWRRPRSTWTRSPTTRG